MDKEQEKQLENIKNGVLRKFPLLGVTMSNLKFCPSNEIELAGTNGEQLFYSPSAVNKLTFDEKVCLFSHEIMHVAFNHILRCKDKNPGDWNVATDAVINQILKKANLPLPEGGIDMKNAYKKSAEEMYEILQNQRQKQNQNRQQNNQNVQQNNQIEQNGKGQNQNQQKNVEHKQSEEQNQQGANNQNIQQNNQSEQNGNGQNLNQRNNNEHKQSEGQNEQGASNKNEPNDQNRQQSEKKYDGLGKHSLWQKAVEKAESEQKKQSRFKKQNQSQDEKNQDSQSDSLNKQTNEQSNTQLSSSDFEKMFSQMNQELKNQIGEQIREKLRQQKDDVGVGSGGYESSFENVGEAASVLSWKKILKRELEKEEDRWSYRRADEENDYQARIGSLDVEDYPETECMLDVSGSVDDEFLKGFLRQLKPLLKQSKLKVGCFDEFVYPFVEIKTIKDIDHFRVTRKSAWTENWDAAVRAFSKKRGVNKIIFTDGCPCPGVMPKDDLSKVNVIWLVFENKYFHPCCGKVIYVEREKLEYLNSANKNVDFTM